MTDINDLVQELWWTASDGVVGASFFAMRRLLEILHECFDISEVCFVTIIFVFATVIDLADKLLQMSGSPNSWVWHHCSHWPLDDRIRAEFKILFDGYRKLFDQSLSKSKDLGDMLRFLPGVVVQKQMSMQGMAELYRIKPDLLERLLRSSIEPLRPSESDTSPYPGYILDDHLLCFLQDRDRSQLCYCDPMLQHISICRQILSLLDGSNAFDFQSYVFA